MEIGNESQSTLLKSGCTRHSSQKHVCSRGFGHFTLLSMIEYLLLQCSVGANVYDVYQVYTGNGSSE